MDFAEYVSTAFTHKLDYVSEQEFYGNRSYWHGSRTNDGKPPLISKIGVENANYKETYFTSHFGYALAYALDFDDPKPFAKVSNGNDLINTGKKVVTIDDAIKNTIKNSKITPWMVLFKVQPNIRLFHAWDYADIRKLFEVMQSASQKFKDFALKVGTPENLNRELQPLRTIDWLSDIHKRYPFNREELLEIIRKANVSGRFLWKGYLNKEKQNFPSIGLFHEHLSQLNVGPLYQVKLSDTGNAIVIERYNGSVNASIPHNQEPNSKPLGA